MKRFVQLMMLGAVLGSPVVNSAEVKVDWQAPEKFTDIRAGDEHRKHFRERLFSDLSEHLATLADNLPAEQTLAFTVTNIDLAGTIRYNNGRQLRVIKPVDIPSMRFDYVQQDGQGNVIKADSVSLKDMGFMHNTLLRYRNEAYGYEKKMLTDWFKSTLLPTVVTD